MAWALIALLAGCVGEPGDELSTEDSSDAEPAPDDVGGDECVPFDSFTCRDGNVHALDSCGETHDLLDECTGEATCLPGVANCCSPTPASGPSQLDLNAYVVRSDVHMSAATSQLQWEIEVLDAPTDLPDVHDYMMFVFDFNVGSHRMFLAMGTDLGDAIGRPHGFYLTDLTDPSVDFRIGGPGGYEETTATARGVRQPYPWTTGQYVLALTRGEPTATGNWFELTIREQGQTETTSLGALDIPGDGENPVEIAQRQAAYMYIYSGAEDYADIPKFAARIKPVATDASLVLVTTEYREFEASDSRWDGDALYMSMGQGTLRCSSGGTLYSAN